MIVDLRVIFQAQQLLMRHYHGIESANGAVVIDDDRQGNLDDRDVQIRMKDLAYRCVTELVEATNELKNKPWKATETATDVQHFREEIADVLHFFVELCITAGITAEELHELYFEKHRTNRTRQKTGY